MEISVVQSEIYPSSHVVASVSCFIFCIWYEMKCGKTCNGSEPVLSITTIIPNSDGTINSKNIQESKLATARGNGGWATVSLFTCHAHIFFSHSLISRQLRARAGGRGGGGFRNKDTALTKLPTENWLWPCPLFTYRCIVVNLHNVFSYFFIFQPTPHPFPQLAGMLRGAAW